MQKLNATELRSPKSFWKWSAMLGTHTCPILKLTINYNNQYSLAMAWKHMVQEKINEYLKINYNIYGQLIFNNSTKTNQ